MKYDLANYTVGLQCTHYDQRKRTKQDNVKVGLV